MRIFRACFLDPKSADEDERRAEYILNVILVSSILMLLFFAGLVLYYSMREGSHYHEVSFGLFSILPLFFMFLLALSRRGFPGLASYLLVGAYLLSNSYAARQWGVDLHIVVLSYALIILMASILVGTWFGFLTVAIIGGIIVPLRFLQLSGRIRLEPRADRVADAVVLAVVLLLIMLLAWLWNREVAKSLARARKSESELKKERDMLEITVEERTQALRQTQFEKMEQIYQFAEFGQLASGLFHDLLNLVNAASLVDEVKAPASQKSTISHRVDGFMQAIRRQLNHQETQKLFSLAEAVEYVMQLLSYKAMKAGIRIVFAQKGDRDLVYFGDTFKFHQVVMNLVLNALDAYGSPAGNGGERSIAIDTRQKEDFVEIRVSDYGRGIHEVVRAKIFEPFFTMKHDSKGMGIGLATVKKFVEKDFHGTILVESEVGKGSTFTVRFPVSPHLKNPPPALRAKRPKA